MAGPDQQAILRMYQIMATIRQADDQVRSRVLSGRWALLLHSPRGQEAISAGVAVNLQAEDYWVTTYRGMHDIIAKGSSLSALFAEYLGKATGFCKGKGGPFHVTDIGSGLMANTGVVGGGLPIANGLGLSSLLRRDGKVTVVSFGDGAANIGAFHESLNLAQLWKLPVIFLCQNNLFAENTTFVDHQVLQRVSDRAAAYGMPGVSVDGTDPVAVSTAAAEAITRARTGEGPTLIEAIAYRLDGHYIGETPHGPAEELERALANDPVTTFRARILKDRSASEEVLAAMEQRIAGDVEAALAFADDGPLPSVDELHRDVYAEVAG